MLTEQQCEKIEKGLTAQVEPRRVAAYLCLHMGLTLAEAAALRVGDIDFENGTVFVRHALGKVEDGATALLPCDAPRTLPMPPHVRRYLRRHRGLYGDGEEAFLMSGSKSAPSFYGIQNLLTSICRRQGVDRAVSATDLRNAFIRRCIEREWICTACAPISGSGIRIFSFAGSIRISRRIWRRYLLRRDLWRMRGTGGARTAYLRQGA